MDRPSDPAPTRWAFLDVLRGGAALAAVFEYSLCESLPGYSSFCTRLFTPGQFGVRRPNTIISPNASTSGLVRQFVSTAIALRS